MALDPFFEIVSCCKHSSFGLYSIGLVENGLEKFRLLFRFNRDQPYRAQQAGGLERPARGIEGLVGGSHDISIVHDLPINFAHVKVADSVGGKIGYLNVYRVGALLEILPDTCTHW